MTDKKTEQPNAESGAEAARHIGGAAQAAKNNAGTGAAVSKEGLTPDPSKGSAPKEGGSKS